MNTKFSLGESGRTDTNSWGKGLKACFEMAVGEQEYGLGAVGIDGICYREWCSMGHGSGGQE